MSDHLFDHAVRDWLEDGSDRTPPAAVDAVLLAVKTTPQDRDLRIPWRFPLMSVFTRATGIAAIALVAVVSTGALLYLNGTGPSGPGGQTTPPATVATPEPSRPGITGWKTYTSAVYGYTISYPEDWYVGGRATQKWQPGEPVDAPSSDLFANDDDDMAFVALQFPAPTGADLASWEGLLAALTEMCAKPAEFYAETPCPSEGVTRMCLGSSGCQPVAFVHDNDLPRALFGDPETGIFTYILVGRVDDYPAAARYGGTVMLLKSILSQLDVREPQPGETPK